MNTNHQPVVLITGAARRLGAIITKALHAQKYRVVIHYRHSQAEALALCQMLNDSRPNSAITLYADLNKIEQCPDLANQAAAAWDRLDVLINNASAYYATPIQTATETQWETLVNSNLKAAYFLIQSAAPYLQTTQGSVVNMIDINAQKPLKNYSIYCIAKAGLQMLTRSLAQELAPLVRVNGIAPGHTLWPEGSNHLSPSEKEQRLDQNLLKQLVNPDDIAKSILFLLRQSSITGQVLNVDCGKLLGA